MSSKIVNLNGHKLKAQRVVIKIESIVGRLNGLKR
jgi:hypothetical protein